MHWWIATMAVLYALSGITVVRADEVAVILRWGRLVGETRALQEHGPGLLVALPRPIDQVVRVPIKRVWEVPIETLSGTAAITTTTSLNPVTQGYAVTGDQNIVHTNVIARYRVRDAAEWAFYGANADDILRVEVTAALVRSIGEMGVDRLLSDGRKDLVTVTARRTQAGLDSARSGLELSSLELIDLAPPVALAYAFDAVQSAYIGAETKKQQAAAYAATVVPQAQAQANAAVQNARGSADGELARAKGDADAFLALSREYRANPAVVRERLYRDAIERAIGSAGSVRWVPPPVGGKYTGFRITLTAPLAGPPATSQIPAPASSLYPPPGPNRDPVFGDPNAPLDEEFLPEK
jgi:membrane protease subunit HflK